MKKLISVETTGNVLLVIFGLLVVFHILILFNLLPSNVVWGGRAGSSSNLRTLLTVSLIFNVLFALVVAVKVGYIQVGNVSRVINIFLWMIFAYLLLNTIGNLASSSSLETLLFTPITIVAAILVLWIWQTRWPIWIRLILVAGLAWMTEYTFFPRFLFGSQ